MSDGIVSYALEDGDVAVLRWDDGGANVVSTAFVAEMAAHLDRAAQEARAVALIGRPGRFCAGFDLSVMGQGGRAVVDLVLGGARLALRLYGHPTPVVAGCTGHAVAMGAVLLMACDARVGTTGRFKIGLNEVAIGMTFPPFGIAFAEERLARTHLQRAVAGAEIFTPDDAVAAGFLDRTVGEAALEEETLAEARRWGALDAQAHVGTKQRMRGAFIERVEAGLSGPL
jgi:enoyl-CoA hydratase